MGPFCACCSAVDALWQLKTLAERTDQETEFTTLDALHSKQALSTLAGFTVEAGKANAEQLLIR